MLVSIKNDTAASAFAATNVSFADRRDAAEQIAEKLFAAEAAIDAAIAAAASLAAVMPMARQQVGVGAHVGQDALMYAMESCSQLVKSRTSILRTHKALVTAQHDAGMAEVGFMGDCPENTAQAGAPTRHLALVA